LYVVKRYCKTCYDEVASINTESLNTIERRNFMKIQLRRTSPLTVYGIVATECIPYIVDKV
jgi:hypothetical protein